MAIKFGTSGWRAIIADEFTFGNVRIVSQAIAKHLKDSHFAEKGIIVGYDTRFLSEEFARAAAETFAANGIKVFITCRDTPTPVIAYQILKRKAAGAVNITASHNPAEYSGIKFSTDYGGPAPIELTDEIERNIRQHARPCLPAQRQKLIKPFDPRPAYLGRIKQLVDLKAIGRAGLKIGVDVLYGTGREYLDHLLETAGCRVFTLHQNRNPLFAGMPPEPAREQLQELAGLVKKKRLHIGLAVDGDADRFGVIDADGTYLNANQVISLLVAHLSATRPGKTKVARTVATTHMVDALAAQAGLEVVETPVGFKYIGQELVKGGCLIGGEESGGLSIAGHIPEKDGILACLLIAELVALRKKPLSMILKELYRQVGPFFSARCDFRLNEETKKAFSVKIKDLSRQTSLSGRTVSRFNGSDGYKFIFRDGSWIMFRLSGTEPVVRCYLEAKSVKQLKELQSLGQRLIKK